MPKKLILIIEDEKTIRAQLADAFGVEGYPVKTAENGEAALTLIQNLAEPPALIFLDLMMPVMDGQGFLIALQRRPENSRFSTIPIVVLSAARMEVFGTVAAYIRKPPDLVQLMDLAEKYAGG